MHAQIEQGNAQRKHDDARKTHNGIEYLHDLGIDFFYVLSLVVNLCNVVIGANMDHASIDQAGINKAAAHELGAGLLANQIAFAGKKTFVDLGIARNYNGVGGNLVTTSQANDIVKNDLVQIHLNLRTVANHRRTLACKKRQFIDHTLRTPRLDDANSRIEHDNAKKAQVLYGTGKDDKNSQDKIDEVEKRAEVFDDQLFDRLGF